MPNKDEFLKELMDLAGVLKDDLWRTIKLPQYRDIPASMVLGIIKLLETEFTECIPLSNAQNEEENEDGEDWKK